MIIAAVHFCYKPILEVTTLETYAMSRAILFISGSVIALMLLDLLQFLWLWNLLRGLLQALDRETFKRSFVPIDNFKWRKLWSFSGISFRDRRSIDAALVDCVVDLPRYQALAEIGPSAVTLKEMRWYYNGVLEIPVSQRQFENDRMLFYGILEQVGSWIADYMSRQNEEEVGTKISANEDAFLRALAARNEGDAGRFNDEREEVARLSDQQRAMEKLLCLMYIGFIQTVIARLHSLFISVASMFSLVVLAIAIYPFVPFSPLLLIGLTLLLVIGWSFFKVFSEMDTDPILSRIVNGDDRKLQGSFYTKFAEALALPVLTLGSSLLPGGAGRLLELAQTFLNHAQ